jgi:hypothetical protein
MEKVKTKIASRFWLSLPCFRSTSLFNKGTRAWIFGENQTRK